ncbi:protein DEK-like isoform X1 [Centruroides sculpturatus]|uniref:protein DEK-like isoform X1 n=1 Tax=Centruroides sculpturatus TaxID=218467 RepID=UPI000C6E40A3|nr:protein DEK-like isoform X1 [Centruroides sculpturatus]
MSVEFESVEGNVSSEDESGGNEMIEKKESLSPKKEEKPLKENNKKSSIKKQKTDDEDDNTNDDEEDDNDNEDASDKNAADKSEEEEEEEKDEEPKLGLLDQPVEISGSRERKKVQRLEVSFTTPSKEKHEIPEGNGEKLGDCPRIEYQIQKSKVEELKILHRILFNRPGSGIEIRKNLRRFNGFPFTKESSEFEKKKNNLDKLTLPVLKRVCDILDLERSGTKEDIVSRISEFLLYPKASGKSVPKTKKKSSSKGEKKKPKSEKDKSDKKKISKKKEDSSSEEKEDTNDFSEEENEDDYDANDDEDYEDEPKQKKSSKDNQAKKKKESKSKKSEEKKSSKSSKKSKRAANSEEESDDEPLVKKAKSPPSDEEIKQLVKQILDGANLEEITMKKVIKQVFDEYPEFDLGDKKSFIKVTVRSLIS